MLYRRYLCYSSCLDSIFSVFDFFWFAVLQKIGFAPFWIFLVLNFARFFPFDTQECNASGYLPTDNLFLFSIKQVIMSKQSKKQFEQLLNLLHELNIQRVDSDFVEDLWRGEIDEDNITAPKVTEETLTDVLTEITSNKYLPKEAATPSSVGRLWTLMTEREMPPRNLVALLYQIIRSSKNSDLSFLAAHIYIAMLQLPGSNVYNVFNPFVFRTVLNLVREWTVRGNSKSTLDLLLNFVTDKLY